MEVVESWVKSRMAETQGPDCFMPKSSDQEKQPEGIRTPALLLAKHEPRLRRLHREPYDNGGASHDALMEYHPHRSMSLIGTNQPSGP